MIDVFVPEKHDFIDKFKTPIYRRKRQVQNTAVNTFLTVELVNNWKMLVRNKKKIKAS